MSPTDPWHLLSEAAICIEMCNFPTISVNMFDMAIDFLEKTEGDSRTVNALHSSWKALFERQKMFRNALSADQASPHDLAMINEFVVALCAFFREREGRVPGCSIGAMALDGIESQGQFGMLSRFFGGTDHLQVNNSA